MARYGIAILLEKNRVIDIHSPNSTRGFRVDIVIWERCPPEDVRKSALTSMQWKGGGVEYYGMTFQDAAYIKSRLS